MERVAGIEPAPSAWKAEVLPLNYTRRVVYLGREYGGGGRIRTFEAFATELQSVGFDRSPTPPIDVLDTVENGAGCRNRTGDLLITSQLLYLLS